jgi:DNA primase
VIPDAKIQEVRERVDMIALVQRHGVELKKAGRSYKGRCPFHQEKSPSFNVWPDEKRFYCFGCQAGGDAISFVQRLLGKTFIDTVTDLASELGIDIQADVDPAMKEKQQVKDATDFAATHFTQRLWDAAVGHDAREYLRTRGLSEDVMRAFGLGWAPLAWTELADKLLEQGLLAFGEKAGLVSQRSKGEGYYDMFRGRVIIPIRSPEGRTIAFGARLLKGDDGPKYLNSKENRLYNKSDVLYGTDQARDEIRRRKSAVLCEGYFDCIGMHQAGVKNAVALCSTALTPGHLQLLHRLEAKELVLLLDGDDAGRKAVERLGGVILAAGVSSRVALLPDGEDPDTFARKAGAEAVHKMIQTARPLTQYLFETVLPEGAASTFEAKMEGLERLRPITAAIPVGLTRSAFFGAMAAHFGWPASELERTLLKAAAAVRSVPRLIPAEPPAPLQERKYAACVLKSPSLLKKDEFRVFDELKHTGIRRLIAAVQAGEVTDALYEASEDLKRSLREVQVPNTDELLEQGFLRVCTDLKRQAVQDRLDRVRAMIANTAGASTDLTQESRDLLNEQGELQRLLNQLEKKKR